MIKKIFGILATLLAVSLMLTPLAIAKPGAVKSNDDFEFFELVCSGAGDQDYDRFWITPQNLEDPMDNKTAHGRNGGWVTGDTVELTIGDETFTMDTNPYSVTYTTTFDLEITRNNDGTLRRYNIRLTDVVTLYEENVEIGTLVLKLRSVVDFTGGLPPAYAGTVVGYGTEALKGVHVSGTDIGAIGGGLFMRNGTITGWPMDITNN